MSTPLILASSSPFRKALLEKLQLPFSTFDPAIDESAHLNEDPEQLVERLSIAKAQAGKQQFDHHWIIGSDQVCVLDGQITGKPGNFANAVAQLKKAQGKRVTFYTGLALYHTGTEKLHHTVEPFHVQFRSLSDNEIAAYVELEQPYWCAGSFKCEGLGISLFESMQGRDPNTLIGLPLIALTDMLRQEGISPLR
ncbi:Maf family protein [Thaumasiovibrio sp. DFM-14]|uniref:Maf family protein n=1 Tax=Thaumasiovibrio sp. DFM-14 TaxID=3384792 RepID=UPI0039A0FE39